jgi:hypothetical protein
VFQASLQQLPTGNGTVDGGGDDDDELHRHLKRLLLQTTWIPVAIGPSFTHHGHLDGAFSTVQHPNCRRQVGLEIIPPYRIRRQKGVRALWADFWTLWSNTLNPSLSEGDVDYLFNMGYEYGV